MKFGVREICDVTLKTNEAGQKVGGTIVAAAYTPVIHFDSLKTSSLEGATTTVYAQGGKGNTRLIAWEGEKTLTFTMEDALISPIGMALLASADITINTSVVGATVHATGLFTVATAATLKIDGVVPTGADVYCAKVLDGSYGDFTKVAAEDVVPGTTDTTLTIDGAVAGETYFVDYYIKKSVKNTLMEITAESFGGNYYLEASTLFRNEKGKDMPAEFIIPNCKIQSNFTFTMASTGDPSTFTFTLDAFPGFTRFDATKKVLCAISVIEE